MYSELSVKFRLKRCSRSKCLPCKQRSWGWSPSSTSTAAVSVSNIILHYTMWSVVYSAQFNQLSYKSTTKILYSIKFKHCQSEGGIKWNIETHIVKSRKRILWLDHKVTNTFIYTHINPTTSGQKNAQLGECLTQGTVKHLWVLWFSWLRRCLSSKEEVLCSNFSIIRISCHLVQMTFSQCTECIKWFVSVWKLFPDL